MPEIFSIPAELPFLDTLVAGILARAGDDPLALTRHTILLPTRRAARSLGEAFLRASAGRALLLPRLVPVGDLDGDELALAADDVSGESIEIPPALPPLQRQLKLAQLVLKFGRRTGIGPMLPGQAVPLARALARFLDEVGAAQGDFATLATLAPDKFAEHWQKVLEFLGIVTEYWPRMLDEAEALDPAERRNRVLAARIAAWRRAPPADPVIAAGLTGGIPAVADIIAAVAQLPLGAVVLPGFDLGSVEIETVATDSTHPQHLMARLIQHLGITAEEVRPWPAGAVENGTRRALIRAALAPAAASDRWRGIKGIDERSIRDLHRLDCHGAQEEAEVIALLMRQCLVTPGKTAALVTPDRDLARRVAAELARWDIAIDDSAGVPLNRTPPAVFLRLILAAASEALAPLPFLAVLKHPLAGAGMPPEILRARIRRLEIAALRGPRPAPGFAGLRDALAADDGNARDLVDKLEAALAPLIDALAAQERSLAALVTAHIACAEHLAATDRENGAERLWTGEAGEAAAQFVAELADAAPSFTPLSGADYPALFEALIAGPVVRPRYGLHPRLAIWGLLEARLQRADLMILGGLNEGVWPPQIETDAFLSRPMRRDFGLPSPEERVGAAAHDFAQGLGAPEVVLTRAQRVEGTPTVPSRWLLRLETVLRAAGLEGRLAAREPLDWQRRLDAPDERRPAAQPEPRPPVAARPRQLPVTQIETLTRDPYSVYARTILRLKSLDPIDAAPDAADRGTFIHRTLDDFLKRYPAALPGDAVEKLLRLGDEHFARDLDRPELRAFWWPRFERVARWFVETETERRRAMPEIKSEINGRMTLDAPFAPFLLTAKADRIDRQRDGALTIIDYKTGGLPRKSDWEFGYSPQLPLEAAIAEAGGFDGVLASPVAALQFWRLSGGDPPSEIKDLAENGELRALIDRALPGLKRLVAAFDDSRTPYRAVPRAEYAPRYNDYAHLARVKEWAAADGDEE
jgi:ATP-dependent helicase/nuclease subunit B